jgi:hypothetical protein
LRRKDKKIRHTFMPAEFQRAPLLPEEDAILDALHFLLSFEELQAETGLEKNQLQVCLRRLIESGDVQVWAWVPDKNDYQAIEEVPEQLEQYHFLATKEGLFRHHSA